MTHDYKAALDDLRTSPAIGIDSCYWLIKNEYKETTIHALQLAQQSADLQREAEQLRKEKDAIKQVLEGAKALLAANSCAIDELRKQLEEMRQERDEFLNEVLNVINQALCFPSKKEGTNCITLDAYYALERLREKIKAKKVSENGGKK